MWFVVEGPESQSLGLTKRRVVSALPIVPVRFGVKQ